MVEGQDMFIYMVYYIDRLSYVEPSLHLWDKAYLIMVFEVLPDDSLNFLIIIRYISIFISDFIDLDAFSLPFALSLIISWHLFLLIEFPSSHSRAFSFNLVDLSIGWNIPSSAFCMAEFMYRHCLNLVLSWNVLLTPSMVIESFAGLDLFMVSQISWTLCLMNFLDLVFSLTDESISSIASSSIFMRLF
ncbi:hypothetical protein STEG23_029858 [Scotinomys teguina]